MRLASRLSKNDNNKRKGEKKATNKLAQEPETLVCRTNFIKLPKKNKLKVLRIVRENVLMLIFMAFSWDISGIRLFSERYFLFHIFFFSLIFFFVPLQFFFYHFSIFINFSFYFHIFSFSFFSTFPFLFFYFRSFCHFLSRSKFLFCYFLSFFLLRSFI